MHLLFPYIFSKLLSGSGDVSRELPMLGDSQVSSLVMCGFDKALINEVFYMPTMHTCISPTPLSSLVIW